MRLSIPKVRAVGQEEDMHLEHTAGVDLTVLEGVDPMDPEEVATEQAEAATELVVEGEEYQWARWQLERALA